jgi:hypothetical protein
LTKSIMLSMTNFRSLFGDWYKLRPHATMRRRKRLCMIWFSRKESIPAMHQRNPQNLLDICKAYLSITTAKEF